MKLHEIAAIQDKAAAEQMVARVAAKYRANEFEQFEAEIRNIMPPVLRPYIDTKLAHLFDLYNPERQQKGAEIWDRMIKDPQRYIDQG